jgi:hypothetical protein
MISVIGKFTVPVPGTPVRFTSTQATPGEKFSCHGVLAQALPANTGKVYIGVAGLDKTTLANVLAVLAIPTDHTIPSFTAALTLSPNAINMADLYLDADVAAEGALVSVLIA